MAASAWRRAAALRREERGFTLIELLVATGLGLIVIGGAFTVFAGGVRSEPHTASKAAALEEARVTADRITRELRQGIEVPSSPASSSTRLTILTYVKQSTCGGAGASTSIPCRVTYNCSGEICTRTVARPDGSKPGVSVRVAEGLTSPAVFSYSPSAVAPTYVGVAFSFSNDGEPVVLEDGSALRNTGEEP